MLTEPRVKLHVAVAKVPQAVDDYLISEIWFESGEFAFPEKGWWEDAITVLNNWTTLLGDRRFEHEVLYFREGSFEVDLQRRGEAVTWSFIHQDEVVHVVDTPVRILFACIYEATQSLQQELLEVGNELLLARFRQSCQRAKKLSA